MRRLLIAACLLTAAPTAAHADDTRSDRCVACPVEFPNVAPGQTWILNATGNLYVAVNPSTGQSVLVSSSGVPAGFYTVGNGVTLIVPGSGGIVGAFVPTPGATPNLFHGAGAPSAPTVWGPNGAPGSNGAPAGNPGGNAPSGPAAPQPRNGDPGDSPHNR